MDPIERKFNEKLPRERKKEQYLRIQACTLARSYPEVAPKLLDRYFELPDDFDNAQAHVDRARALLALGRMSGAIADYEAALARESEFPKLQTEAYLDLPFLIATRSLRDHNSRATELLHLHEARLKFPIDHFRWHAAHALIADATHKVDAASAHAQRALDASTPVSATTDRWTCHGSVRRDHMETEPSVPHDNRLQRNPIHVGWSTEHGLNITTRTADVLLPTHTE